MPNPVAANDLQPISGSLQTSRISYGVETAGKNYGQNYNGSNWYSDIPNNGQFYTIISDNYTANYYVSRSNAGGAYVEGGLPAVDEYSAPVFWVTPGTSSLDVITIVNGLPDRIGQVPFNSGSQALNWVASSSNYFAVGPDYYNQMDADNLGFCFEGNQIISYPTTGSTWYDISGNGNNGTFQNGGPSFNSNGWLSFDGTDDFIQIPDSATMSNTSSLSICALVKFNSLSGTYQAIIGKGSGSAPDANEEYTLSIASTALYFDVGQGSGPYINPSLSLTANRWYHISATHARTGGTSNLIAYSNGVALTATTQGASNTPNNNDYPASIGRRAYSGFPYGNDTLNGDLASIQLYLKTLSASEVLQNYYGGPIVTTDLYSRLDAGNLVSYPKTGTTSYELVSGGAGNGALTNGPSFTTAFGGGWVMDGVDDYLRTNVDSNALTPNNSWTVSVWCSLNSYPTYSGTTLNGVLFGYAYYGGLGIYALTTAASTVNVYGFFRSDSSAALFGGYAWTLNTPTMFTLVHEAGVGCRFYVNGQLNTTSGTTGGSWPGYMPNPWNLWSPQNGVYGGGSETYIYYPITTYSTTVYKDKALTSDEVLQNYNATN